MNTLLLLILSSADAPNVVLILADDLGWNAVGYHADDSGRPFVKTPNIDRLAAEGAELDHFYVAPMCSPTRAGLLTGRYPIRFGLARAVIPPYRDYGLPLTEQTLADALADLGYERRGIFGKWHLGHRRAKWHPLNRGFSDFHGHYNGAIDYFELTRDGERDWHRNYAPSSQTGYATDLIAEAAAAFITDAASEDSPYLCYVPFNAPHSPFQVPGDELAKVDAKLPTKKRTLAAMIARMDTGIGRLIEAVENTGEADNTIVWFISDNGGVGNIPGNNRPLRGSKLTSYEGGIRVPACVRWPARIKPGTVAQERCGYIDVLPTLVDAAGGSPSKNIDGLSLRPILTGETDSLTPRPWFTYHGQQGEQKEHLAVHEGQWKLTYTGPRPDAADDLRGAELFDIDADPNETTNIADDNREVVARLAAMLVEHRRLQPANAVPPYRSGSAGFTPPKNWQLDPANPNELVGTRP